MVILRVQELESHSYFACNLHIKKYFCNLTCSGCFLIRHVQPVACPSSSAIKNSHPVLRFFSPVTGREMGTLGLHSLQISRGLHFGCCGLEGMPSFKTPR